MSFSVSKTSQSLVAPASPTPVETLGLSVIDRVAGLRHLVRSLHVFRHGVRPATVIREALSKALVPYYPFAGRFVESDGDVWLAATGEGVVFVEATANCSLGDVNYLDHPLLIPQEDLLPHPSPNMDIDPLDLPFMMMQVTDFSCGGFVVGLISVHTIADGLGAAQFINAIAEHARGVAQPTLPPVWSRELIPNPPKLISGTPPVIPSIKLQSCTADISPQSIARTKAKFFEETGQHCSTFDISAAKAWQSRTRAIGIEGTENVHLCFFANTRHLLAGILPAGYYGNCFYPVTVTAASGLVAGADLVEVVGIIREAKATLPVEFAKWAGGEYERKDPYELDFGYNSLFVSDWTRLGFMEVDYGWGKPVHVVPFAFYDFMSVAIIGAPAAPKKGSRLMMQCVVKEQMQGLQKELQGL